MLKKFLFGFLILVVVILAGLLLLPVLIPEDSVKSMLSDQVESATGRTLTVEDRLEWKILPRISLEAGGITLSNPPGFQGEPFLEAGRLNVSVRVLPLFQRRLEIGDVTIEQATLRLLTDASGRDNMAGLAGGEQTGAGDAPELSTGTIRLRDAELVMADARLGTRDSYQLNHFELEPFRFNRPVDFNMRGRIGDPPVLEDLRVSGTVRVPAFGDTFQMTGLEISGRAPGADLPVRLSGDLELRPGPPALLSFEHGRLEMGGDQAALSFGLRQGSPARITASLEAETLNLDQMLVATERNPEGTQDTRGAEPAAADHPLVFLREMDLDADLRIDVLQVSGLEIEAVRANARSRDGVLNLEPLRGDLAGGSFNGTAVIDTRPVSPEVMVRPRFDVPALGEALAAWGLADHIDGSGRLVLNLRASGLNPESLLDSLAGSGSVNLSDGRIRGIDLVALVRGVEARDPGRMAAAIGGETPFSSFDSGIEIRDGRMLLPDLHLVSEAVDIGGRLSLGLSGLGLDGTVRFNREELRRLPIALSGTLTAPELSLDVENAAREEIGRRLLEVLESRDDDRSDGDSAEDGTEGGNAP